MESFIDLADFQKHFRLAHADNPECNGCGCEIEPHMLRHKVGLIRIKYFCGGCWDDRNSIQPGREHRHL